MLKGLLLIVSILLFSISKGQNSGSVSKKNESLAVHGQTKEVRRLSNESKVAFAQRIGPDSTEMDTNVIETKVLDSAKTVLIAFYYRTIKKATQEKTYVDHYDLHFLIGYLYIPAENKDLYYPVLIDSIADEGGIAELSSVFFAHAHFDGSKAIAVLVTYNQIHYDYDGTIYETLIYDAPSLASPPQHLNYLQQLSEKFFGCDCGYRDGRNEKAKYKTAGDVRKELKRLGYK
jgi:hypothetical protein